VDTPRPSPRTNRTRRVPHPVLIGHAASLSQDAHDPSLLRLRTVDRELAALLRAAGAPARDGRETVVVLAGDHGVWYGEYFERARGARLEAVRPALRFILPPGLLAQRPEYARALAANAGRLATPLDVHATLAELLGMLRPPRDGARRAGAEERKRSADPAGRSLLAPLPPARGCAGAGVAVEHCACAEVAVLPPAALLASEPQALARLALRSMQREIARGVGREPAGSATRCVALELAGVDAAERLRSEVAAGALRADGVMRLRFRTRGGAGFGEESFEALLLRTLPPLREGLPPGHPLIDAQLPLVSLRVGLGYSEEAGVFEQARARTVRPKSGR